MPGRILVYDPIITNRLMLKAQLSHDFFDVCLATDLTDLQSNLRHNRPDVVLMSYHADRATNFEAVNWIKSNPVTHYVPIVFLANASDTSVWDHSHDFLVEDVVHYTAPKWVMTARLNLLIRSKEHIDGLVAQHRTMSDMGFAEQNLSFPPPSTQQHFIDLTLAHASFDDAFIAQVAALLSQDFPSLQIITKSRRLPHTRTADLYVIDPDPLGQGAAFAKMMALRRSGAQNAAAVLFTTDIANQKLMQRALEFGANDFAATACCATEMASRIRRVLWHRDMAKNAEQSVSHHLQSALHDPLTGLYNRRYALQHLNRLMLAAKPTGRAVTAMVIDLDRFKTINDTYGHLTGDLVLQETAQRLRKNLRTADLLARIGGEEFLVVLEGASMDRVRRIAERLRRQISSTPYTAADGQPIALSASIGVGATRTTWDTCTAIIDSADVALYRAKNSGRDCVTFNEKAA
ncbi:diguanylate cyclase [Amylibacter sp. IMCC11727]|uniref:diguanylate cyclase n=1 Tax=Amylibacter sp. IMCC11727 TaxID=3039851 RepID=UPI00244DAE4A|nr:diguanylate cyclase [Amylibacter sp. IMCC11727]WGI20982.1 diguanylate cyclase [Amylibacter sp. IMCC11727]